MRLKFLLLCVATFGFAGPIDGDYIIKEPTGQHGGGVSISQRSPSMLMFSIGTIVVPGNICQEVTGTAKKMGNVWRYQENPGNDNSGNQNSDDEFPLRLDFKIVGDVITVTSENGRYYCGLRARFDHTFVKSKKQTFDESKPELTNKEYIAIKKSVEKYAKADLELSKAYKKLMNSFTFQQKQELKEEQRLWIKMRDEQAFQVGPKNSYKYSSKLTELTKERAEYLSAMAK